MQVITLNSGDPERSQVCAAPVRRELLKDDIETKRLSEQGEVNVDTG